MSPLSSYVEIISGKGDESPRRRRCGIKEGRGDIANFSKWRYDDRQKEGRKEGDSRYVNSITVLDVAIVVVVTVAAAQKRQTANKSQSGLEFEIGLGGCEKGTFFRASFPDYSNKMGN